MKTGVQIVGAVTRLHEHQSGACTAAKEPICRNFIPESDVHFHENGAFFVLGRCARKSQSERLPRPQVGQTPKSSI